MQLVNLVRNFQLNLNFDIAERYFEAIYLFFLMYNILSIKATPTIKGICQNITIHFSKYIQY